MSSSPSAPTRGVGSVMAIAARRALIGLLVLAAAVALGWLVDDRVADQRRADALARSVRVPAVTSPPTIIAAAGQPVADSPAPPGALPSAAAVATALASALAQPALGAQLIGTVLDGGSGAVLLDQGATQGAAPASTAKLATASAALAAIGPATRFTTRVVVGAQPGQIVLVGGGDPTLSAAPTGTATPYADAARLSDVAAAISAKGTAVSAIVVDSSLFVGPSTAPGWDPEDAPSSYASPITALMVDGSRDAPTAAVRSAAPDIAAGDALAAMLGLPASAVSSGTAPAGAAQITAVQSAPVIELVEEALLESDNVLAEVLSRQVAIATAQPASFAAGAAATESVLVGLNLPGFDPAGLSMVDGSGLSRQDSITPAVLAALLRAASDGAHPVLTGLLDGLPVAGWEGTLAQRYTAAGAPSIGTLPASGAALDAAGVIRAKTGTLTGVSSLAGVLRDVDGRTLVFAFIADQVGPSAADTDAAEAALDTLAGTLAACGCS
jgi:D-alanyl-D-alanine carboxypeptidase/D-alanyl-D-alanine-endopeptidase (penicillin-binding protein 4)